MRQRTWLFQGFALILAIMAVYHPPIPTEAYWNERDFHTSEGTRILIQNSLENIEWEVGQSYSIEVNITVLWLANTVDRLYNITAEVKWATDAIEVVEAPKGPYEITATFQSAVMTFNLTPSKKDYGVIGSQPQSGGFYYRVTSTEALTNGTDSLWTSDWQRAFDVYVTLPYTFDPVLSAIVIFTLGFGLIAIIGAKRRTE
ncbi:MAG: hypothetical protein ACE5OZ_03260 [Candidatus Heimdallarchaeota archaeon]